MTSRPPPSESATTACRTGWPIACRSGGEHGEVPVQPGAVIDGFTIGECVHNGGMATLWSVTRPDIAAPLLMKIPRVSEGEDPAAIVSFEMEQMILPRLSGPHVPACYATGDFARQAYVVIEPIPGKTLYSRLDELPLPYDEVATIAGKIAVALADLHRQNVIHHDIKPSSVMFRPSGEAVLIDYGLSHHNLLPDLLQEEFRVPYGTAPYEAPERLLGVRDDPRSDLFSLGVLLYFFTTGVRPFGEGETMFAMRRRLWRDPQPPRKLRADYPPWLQEIVLRCLEIEPVWRYPTAAQLAFELAHPDQIKLTDAVGAVEARSALDRAAAPLQSRPDAAASRKPISPRNSPHARSWRSRSTRRKDPARDTTVAHYLDALEWQKEIVKIHAVFGGKNPHPNYLVGGVPCSINMNEVAAINSERLNLVSRLISQADEFVNQVYIPDLLAVASFYKDWAKWGGGLTNYLSYGEFPTKGYGQPESFKYPRGVVLNRDLSTVHPVNATDSQEIKEYIASSWYSYEGGDSVGIHPWAGETKLNYTGPKPPFETLEGLSRSIRS